MKRKRSVCFTAAALCVIMAFAGCGKKTAPGETKSIIDDNVTAAGELPVVKEKVGIEVGILSTTFVEDYETNAFTQYLEEKTGIDLSFYEFPASGGAEKLYVMLASNSELPDVICGVNLSKGKFLEYADEGVFVELNDYIDKYGYWINEMRDSGAIPNFDGWLTASNGKKYFVPSRGEQIGNRYGGKAFINKTWLDKLGLEMPTTTEEFAKVMKAFVTQDPNGNGKNDEIGFTGSKNGWNEKPVNFLMNSFVYDDYNKGVVVDENKKLSLNYTSDAYKKGLEYIRDLAKSKALDIQCYTQDNNTLRSLCASETPIIGAFASGSPDSLFVDDVTRMQDYVALPPMTGPDGVGYALQGAGTIRSEGIITKYCENPAAAFRLFDFMLSEEASIFARFGVEGKDWVKADENTPCLFRDLGFEARILPITAYSAIQNSNWHQYGPAFYSSDIVNTMAWSGDENDGEYFKAKALKEYVGKGPENLFDMGMVTLNEEDQEEYNDLATQIEEYVKESIPMFVSGEYNLAKDWDSFQKTLKKLNVERYLELIQKGYDAFLSVE